MTIVPSEVVFLAKYIHSHVEDVSSLLRRKLKMIMAIGLLNKEKKKWRVLGGVCRWKNSKRNIGTELIPIYVSSSTSLLDVLQTHSLPLFLIFFWPSYDMRRKKNSERKKKKGEEREGNPSFVVVKYNPIGIWQTRATHGLSPFLLVFFCFSSCLPAAADRHLFLQDRAKKADWLTKIITK